MWFKKIIALTYLAAVFGCSNSARHKLATRELANVICAEIGLYEINNNKLPTTASELDAIIGSKYKDSWDRFVKVEWIEERKFVVVSLGLDGIKSSDDISIEIEIE